MSSGSRITAAATTGPASGPAAGLVAAGNRPYPALERRPLAPERRTDNDLFAKRQPRAACLPFRFAPAAPFALRPVPSRLFHFDSCRMMRMRRGAPQRQRTARKERLCLKASTTKAANANRSFLVSSSRNRHAGRGRGHCRRHQCRRGAPSTADVDHESGLAAMRAVRHDICARRLSRLRPGARPRQAPHHTLCRNRWHRRGALRQPAARLATSSPNGLLIWRPAWPLHSDGSRCLPISCSRSGFWISSSLSASALRFNITPSCRCENYRAGAGTYRRAQGRRAYRSPPGRPECTPSWRSRSFICFGGYSA